MEADSGPHYFGAVWAGDCSSCGFGLDLLGGGSLLSDSALVVRSMVEVRVVLCGTLTDNVPPGHPVGSHIFPGFQIYVSLLKVCF